MGDENLVRMVSSKGAQADEKRGHGINRPADYWEALVRYTGDEQGEPVIGEFASLQKMNITHLLNEIVRIKADIQSSQTTSCEQMNILRTLLHQYCEYQLYQLHTGSS